MILAIQILENDGEFVVSADTVFSERKDRTFNVFQLQRGDDVLYRGHDLKELKQKWRNERSRK